MMAECNGSFRLKYCSKDGQPPQISEQSGTHRAVREMLWP
jgi:hypothetical protein